MRYINLALPYVAVAAGHLSSAFIVSRGGGVRDILAGAAMVAVSGAVAVGLVVAGDLYSERRRR